MDDLTQYGQRPADNECPKCGGTAIMSPRGGWVCMNRLNCDYIEIEQTEEGK